MRSLKGLIALTYSVDVGSSNRLNLSSSILGTLEMEFCFS